MVNTIDVDYLQTGKLNKTQHSNVRRTTRPLRDIGSLKKLTVFHDFTLRRVDYFLFTLNRLGRYFWYFQYKNTPDFVMFLFVSPPYPTSQL